MTTKTLKALLLGAAFALTGSFAHAEEANPEQVHSYYDGNTWSVTLNTAADGQADYYAWPYCEMKSVTDVNKAMSVQFISGDKGDNQMVFKLQKLGWNLPADQTTKVIIGDSNIAFTLTYKTLGDDVLVSQDITPEIITAKVGVFFMGAFPEQTASQAIAVKFTGNEPLWVIPGMQRREARDVSTALLTCQADLTKLGRAKLSNHTPSSTEKSATSPFN